MAQFICKTKNPGVMLYEEMGFSELLLAEDYAHSLPLGTVVEITDTWAKLGEQSVFLVNGMQNAI
jgi:hypothetical protein